MSNFKLQSHGTRRNTNDLRKMGGSLSGGISLLLIVIILSKSCVLSSGLVFRVCQSSMDDNMGKHLDIIQHICRVFTHV